MIKLIIARTAYTLSLLIAVLYCQNCFAMDDKALFNQAVWLPTDEIIMPVRQFSYASEKNSTTESDLSNVLNEYFQKTLVPDFFKYTQRYGMGCMWEPKCYNRECIESLLLRYIGTLHFYKTLDGRERFAQQILDHIESVHLGIAKK